MLDGLTCPPASPYRFVGPCIVTTATRSSGIGVSMKQITLCLLSAILSLPSLSLATNLHDQEAGQESSCPADCAKPCCAEGDQQQKKSSCPTDCAKPCCAEGDQQQKKSSCSKDKSKDCTKSSCSKDKSKDCTKSS
ncbi:MAG: hypothetical protein CMP23_13865, partial [Rickettsiales bacterium]|nr:hypothetical protein [Rickettsiales bacterium]